MRKTILTLSTIGVAAVLSMTAMAAPGGMAPYPGQSGAYTPPPPPPSMDTGSTPNAGGNRGYPPSPNTKPLKPAGCVWSRYIRDWRSVDDRTMIVREGSRRYLVTFSGACRDSRYEFGMAVDTRYSSCLRAGDRVTFGSPFGHYPGQMNFPCYIKKIEELPKQA